MSPGRVPSSFGHAIDIYSVRLAIRQLRSLVRETLLEAENDVTPLLKINQRALRKRDPGYDPRREPERAGNEPIFSSKTLRIINEIPDQHLNRLPNRKGFIKWLANALENEEDVGLNRAMWMHIRDIIDYVVGDDVDLSSLGTLEEVYDDASYWHENQDFSGEHDPRREETNVIYDFGDGYTLVELEQCDLGSEGAEMQHCVASYKVDDGTRILSLRDAQNKSHATIEINDENVRQIKGKQNQPPVEKYASKIREWLPKSGLEYEETLDYITILRPKDLRKLVNSPSSTIRGIIAVLPQTPQDVLLKLVSDKAAGVRQEVARNRKAPPIALSTLSKDPDRGVRIILAMNPSTPKSALVRLSKEKYPAVRNRAKETLAKKETNK